MSSLPPILLNVPNGALGLDSSGNASGALVLATGATTARSLGAMAADMFNIKSFGAALNGSTNDTTAWTAAYNAVPSNGVMFIPGGAGLNATIPHTAGKTIGYFLGGTLDYGTSSPGTNPVTSIGDGDTVFGYWASRWNISKEITTSSNAYACLLVNSTNNTTSGVVSGVVAALHVSGSSVAGSSGFNWPLNVTLSSGGTAGVNVQDVGIASSVTKVAGSCSATWQYFGQTTDQTGMVPNCGSSILIAEFDSSSVGPEVYTTSWNPVSGARAGIHLTASAYSPPVWTASSAIALYAVYTSSPTNGYVYICTKAGTTGSTQPTWPTGTTTYNISSITWASGVVTVVLSSAYQSTLTAGQTFYFTISGCLPSAYNVTSFAGAPTLATVVNSTTFTFPLATNPGTETTLGTAAIGLVLDGSVVWSYSTTVATQFSRGIEVDTGTNATMGAMYCGTATVYNAAIELSYVTLQSANGSSPAAIRLAANMPIDFSANQTLAGQNLRTLLYNSTAGALQYQKSGASVFSIADNGALTSVGTWIDASTQTSAPTTGTTVTIPANCCTYIINPAGTLAALTVNLPSAPSTASGATVEMDIVFIQAITALTIAAGSGTTLSGAASPSSVAKGAVLRYKYVVSLAQWVHTLNI